eukprot:30414-Pelagococcus_subviridis.AAC.4
MRKYAPAPGGGRKPAAHAALNPTRLGHDEHLPPAVPDRVDRCFKRPAWTVRGPTRLGARRSPPRPSSREP